MNVLKKINNLSLVVKIFVGFIIGILVGVILGESATVLAPLGNLFLRLLSMLVLPLVFSAIVSGITNTPSMKDLADVGVKSLVLFVLMTAISVLTGIVTANVLQPGRNSTLTLVVDPNQQVESLSFVDTILQMFPSNVFESFSNGSMLQVIVFALFFGICIVMVGEQAKTVKKFFDQTAIIMYKMTNLVIGFAPIGVAGLIANVIGSQGIESLLSLGRFIIMLHVGLAILIFVVQGLFILIGTGMNPLKFFKALSKSIAMAFATDSSSAALPIAMEELQTNLDVPESIASFVMPVGTNLSKSGSAFYQAFAVIFVSQVVGVDLAFTEQFTLFVTVVLAALGTAGIPSASIVMLSLSLGSVGMPLEAIGILAGIDRIIGGQRTVPNVITNAAIAKIVSRKRGE
ncbi:dicarboxylate/amino acid:cation symporter [Fundicoccus culcitae]|uniref:Dicarboxylate/amino acid:cation symporter n=1 Tax=Fundicoccus culcitae TaxID=2969821 RepID=A0ABY5P4S2_9LACT|nr:dicarboxylate/amino acid:cation symporter [Fundicoccus culcitae]UUX33571.1 dicarboxylate/amino acid:cation symporter [Fundicoccus culcitae]